MEIRYYGDKITHHIAKTPEGFLICQDVPISRTGYQTYLSSEMFDSPSNGHRAIPVYRPAEEVFDVKSLASFEGKPVTNEHPDEDVTPENYSQYACGHVQNVHVGTGADSNKVLADLYITDPHLIHLIQNGKREISCGYYAEERRDAAGRICQTRIRGNHVAVVKNGRAGKNVCIRDKNPDSLCRHKRRGDDMYRDFGVKGMKKGVRRWLQKTKSGAGRVAHHAENAGSVLNRKINPVAREEYRKRETRKGILKGALAGGLTGVGAIPGAIIGGYLANKKAKKRQGILPRLGDSLYDVTSYHNSYGGNGMRKRRYLYDEEPFIDDDALLDDDILEDDDYLADEDEFSDACGYEDDDYLEDDDLMEDDDYEDDDYLADEDEFADDDYLEDDDELMSDDDFEDDDLMEDDDELMADDDFEDDDFGNDDVTPEDVDAEVRDACRDAMTTLRMARESFKKSRQQMRNANRRNLKDAIILNDDDLEDDEEGVIQTDADLEDDDYLTDDDFLTDDDELMADDDELMSDEDFEDDDLMEDGDELLSDSDDFEDDDELLSDADGLDGCEEEPVVDDDVEITEDEGEAEVIDEDKTRALREITEASRGISDPNERKQLQDAIYKALCKKTQMPGLMKVTKKNVKNRMDSANTNKNKVNVADQQSIYDSFNPHKKTSF